MGDRDDDLTDAELAELERLSDWASPAPWRAMIEGRDHRAGDNFIKVGSEGDRDEDMYVSRDSGPAVASDLELIAAARNSVDRLIAEVRRRRRDTKDKDAP